MGGGEKRRPENTGDKSGQEEPTNTDDRELYNSPKPKKVKKSEECGTYYYPHEDCIKIKIELDDQPECSAIPPESKYGDKEEIIQIDDDDQSFCCLSPEVDRAKKVNIKIEIGVEGQDPSSVSAISGTNNTAAKKLKLTGNPSLPSNKIEIIDLTEDLLPSVIDYETDDDVFDIIEKKLEEPARNEEFGDRVSVKVEAAEEPSPTLDEIEIDEETIANNVLVKVEESTLTATVFIAAPFVENNNLEIIGEDKHLGKWAHPQGKFDSVIEINSNWRIFKGSIPVPSRIGSQFKFVHTTSDHKIEYEGEGQSDNRTDQLLPDTWNFFIFKPKSNKSVIFKFLENLKSFNQKSEPGERIAFEFFNIVFNHTCEKVLPGINRLLICCRNN